MIALSDINSQNFDKTALDIFRFQAANNPVYREYLQLLDCDIEKINQIDEIPFLPIELFKSRKVVSVDTENFSHTFESSGTTLTTKSKHYIYSIELYQESFLKGFDYHYGDLEEYCILALLPSYQENQNSSLIYMVDSLLKKTAQNDSQYLLNDLAKAKKILQEKQNTDQKTLLIGVSYALLDLAESFPCDLSNVIIMETGGMKGRRKELTKAELHDQLKNAFQVSSIHSEYGMTELLSQGYSKGENIFDSPPWLKILTRPINEPFGKMQTKRSGLVKVIDLANYYSCSFIETSDLGKVYDNGNFEILGRMDNADIRGCNLLVR